MTTSECERIRDRLARASAGEARAAAVASFTSAHEAILPDCSPVYVTLHGLVQHDLRHGGQLGLVRKA